MLPPIKKNEKNNYYEMMGLNKSAKPDEIKDAFRKKVKEVHPDINKSKTASFDFSLLTKAYKTLSSPDKKQAYDFESTILEQPLDSNAKICCQSCGTTKRTLRFVVFHEVTSIKFRSKASVIQGNFCPECSQKIAVKSSMKTWLYGWFGFPFGFILSLSALLNNLCGGKMPTKLNSRMLLAHARILSEKGEIERAKAEAINALKYTNVPSQTAHIKSLVATLSQVKAKKDRWPIFGYGFFVQITPFLIIAISLGVMFHFFNPKRTTQQIAAITYLSEPEQEKLKVIPLPYNPNDDSLLYKVSSPKLHLHRGPSVSFNIIATLEEKTNVRITALVPNTSWVKVITNDNLEGFVISDFITKN